MHEKLKPYLPENIFLELPKVMADFSINSPLRLAHYLGQTCHESDNYKRTTENLNYSAQKLADTWPTRYAVDPKAKPKVPNELAKKIQRKPEEIANHTYANRFGNGSIESGDGRKYRGRGSIMTTFHDNYAELDKYVPENILENPDLVATKYVLLSGAVFWKNKKLNAIADKGISVPVITEVSKEVNGGTIGLNERIRLTNHFYKILTT